MYDGYQHTIVLPAAGITLVYVPAAAASILYDRRSPSSTMAAQVPAWVRVIMPSGRSDSSFFHGPIRYSSMVYSRPEVRVVGAGRGKAGKAAHEAGVAPLAPHDVLCLPCCELIDIFGIDEELPPQGLDVILAIRNVLVDLDGVVLGSHDHRDLQCLLEGLSMLGDMLGAVHIGDEMAALLISGAVGQTDIIHAACLEVLGHIDHLLLGKASLHVLFRADPAADCHAGAGIADLFGHFHEEALAVAPFSAVHIRPLVGQRREELVLQVPVRAMDLDGIEARTDGQLTAVRKFLLLGVDLVDGHLPRHLSGKPVPGMFGHTDMHRRA